MSRFWQQQSDSEDESSVEEEEEEQVRQVGKFGAQLSDSESGKYSYDCVKFLI